MQADVALLKAMQEDPRDAWELVRRRHPTERVYAFGLYTDTEDAAHLRPFACGEEGLRRVAADYVGNGHYASVEEAITGLRWSIADSPYQDQLPSRRIERELATRADPTDPDLPGTRIAREIRARLNAATAAIQTLDKEGLFGEGRAREQVTLLIEAGDREDEFVLKWAKKLSPPAVFRAFESLGEQPEVGQWSELGTKKVYETTHLAKTSDHRLVATASQYVGCVFDVMASKQLLCRPIPNKDAYWPITGVALRGCSISLLFPWKLLRFSRQNLAYGTASQFRRGPAGVCFRLGP